MSTNKITNKWHSRSTTNLIYNKSMPNEPIEVGPDAITVNQAMVYDGLWVRIHPNDIGSGELIFYRNLNNDIHNLKGESVAVIRIDKLDEFESIANQILDTLRMHKNREP